MLSLPCVQSWRQLTISGRRSSPSAYTRVGLIYNANSSLGVVSALYPISLTTWISAAASERLMCAVKTCGGRYKQRAGCPHSEWPSRGCGRRQTVRSRKCVSPSVSRSASTPRCEAPADLLQCRSRLALPRQGASKGHRRTRPRPRRWAGERRHRRPGGGVLPKSEGQPAAPALVHEPVNSRHRTVASTSANTVICTGARPAGHHPARWPAPDGYDPRTSIYLRLDLRRRYTRLRHNRRVHKTELIKLHFR